MLSQPDAAEWRGIDDKTVEIFSVPWVSVLEHVVLLNQVSSVFFIRLLGYNRFTKVQREMIL